MQQRREYSLNLRASRQNNRVQLRIRCTQIAGFGIYQVRCRAARTRAVVQGVISNDTSHFQPTTGGDGTVSSLGASIRTASQIRTLLLLGVRTCTVTSSNRCRVRVSQTSILHDLCGLLFKFSMGTEGHEETPESS